jgi:hypothetical protein
MGSMGGVDPVVRLDYFRKEHLDILRFLDKWEAAVSLITSKDDERRTKALSELREMESELHAIRNHCYSRSGISSRLIAHTSRKSSSILWPASTRNSGNSFKTSYSSSSLPRWTRLTTLPT